MKPYKSVREVLQQPSVMRQGWIVSDDSGAQQHFVDNVLHREDGPAMFDVFGNEYWFRHGVQHREDGPAVQFKDGYQVWYFQGHRHRVDGPAVHVPGYPAANEFWQHGVRLNEDGSEYYDEEEDSNGFV